MFDNKYKQKDIKNLKKHIKNILNVNIKLNKYKAAIQFRTKHTNAGIPLVMI